MMIQLAAILLVLSSFVVEPALAIVRPRFISSFLSRTKTTTTTVAAAATTTTTTTITTSFLPPFGVRSAISAMTTRAMVATATNVRGGSDSNGRNSTSNNSTNTRTSISNSNNVDEDDPNIITNTNTIEKQQPTTTTTKNNKVKDYFDSEEEDWQDAMENDGEEEEEEAEYFERKNGLGLQEGKSVDDNGRHELYEEEDEDDNDDEGIIEEELDNYFQSARDDASSGKESDVSLAEVLMEQDHQELEDDEFDNEDNFVDTLEDDIQLVASTADYVERAAAFPNPTAATDDDSSSANVDRDDLADAYDVGLEAEEEEEPILATMEQGTVFQGAPETNKKYNTTSTGTEGEGLGKGPLETATNGRAKEYSKAAALKVSKSGEEEEISEDTKDVLVKELQWRSYEVEYMRPDVAAAVAYKRLMRPTTGMPAMWYTEGNTPKGNNSGLSTVIKTVILPIGIAAVALFVGQETGIDACSDILDSLKAPALPCMWKSPTPQSALAVTLSQQTVGSNERVPDDHPHSIKPNSDAANDVPEEASSEQSPLDTFLSKFGNPIDKLLRKLSIK